jgi:hypothetical protein
MVIALCTKILPSDETGVQIDRFCTLKPFMVAIATRADPENTGQKDFRPTYKRNLLLQS